jgi:hypothetical protein
MANDRVSKKGGEVVDLLCLIWRRGCDFPQSHASKCQFSFQKSALCKFTFIIKSMAQLEGKRIPFRIHTSIFYQIDLT